MKQTNQQDSLIKLFADFIADPSAIDANDAKVLDKALEKFPYCQILNLFYSRSLSLSGSEDLKKQLSSTALLIPERKLLYTILKEPEKLREPEKLKYIESVLFADNDTENNGLLGIENTEEFTEELVKETESDSASDIAEQVPDNTIIKEESWSVQIEAEKGIIAEPEIEKPVAEEDVWDARVETESEIKPEEEPEISEQKPEEETRDDQAETVPANDLPEEDQTEERDIAGIHYEIAEEPINDSAELEDTETSTDITDPDKDQVEEHTLLGDIFNTISESTIPSENQVKQEKSEVVPDIEESLQAEIKHEVSQNIKDTSEPENTEADQNVSRYDDDKMPYSFIWWLRKTRMEYAETYQPYTVLGIDNNRNIKKSSVDQLSSQIIENIFHLQSPLEQVENAPRTVPFQIKRKEDSILEKFIKEEPQIRPPDSQKLDTENKARKSAEDPNDLVSETLAHIYADQMLYEKAITTYKKLSLKVPEKSTYFADQIRELQKKVN